MTFSDDFGGRLRDLGMSKAEFGRNLGVSPVTVVRWGNKVPVYALSYLGLLEDLKRLVDKYFG